MPVDRPPIPFRPGVLSTFLVATFLIGCNGCSSLPPGPLEAVGAQSAAPRQGRVYLLRGWNGLWSEGVDALAKEIRSNGIDAHVYQQGQAGALGDAIVAHSRNAPNPEPLVLIGFSFGADEAIRIARKLDDAGLPVDLLVTIDPVTPPAIPANVRACRNYYQSNGAWDALPWLRGVPVPAGETNRARVVNTNIRDRAELLEPDTGHNTIAANRKVHRAILDEVLTACPRR